MATNSKRSPPPLRSWNIISKKENSFDFWTLFYFLQSCNVTFYFSLYLYHFSYSQTYYIYHFDKKKYITSITSFPLFVSLSECYEGGWVSTKLFWKIYTFWLFCILWILYVLFHLNLRAARTWSSCIYLLVFWSCFHTRWFADNLNKNFGLVLLIFWSRF